MLPDLGRLDAIEGYRRTLAKAASGGWYREAERELAKGDLFYLLVRILGRTDVNRDWIYDRCREVQSAPDGRLDLWSREHFKSTAITYGLTIQNILNDPEETFAIFSYTRPIAKAFLRQIKREFEGNEKLRELFPEILWANPHREAPKWSDDDGIIVKRKGNPKESTIEAWGLVDSQPTSKHFGTMIYDDVVTRDSVTTPDMIRKVVESWETSLNLTKEGGRVRYIGTRWRENDLYRTILDRRAAIERRYPGTIDGTPHGEPVLWSRETMARKRREMGSFTFASQILQDPKADSTMGFKAEWIRHYEGGGDFGGMNKYLLVDGASSKKKSSDYTSMVVIGLGADRNFYLLDAVRDRLNLRERGDALFALHRRWHPQIVGYEQYGMMADIEYHRERMGREVYHFDIIELGGTMSKEDRIGRMIPIFEENRFMLPEVLHKVNYEGISVDLVHSFIQEEYLTFPVAQHDDMFDAISRIEDPEITLVWPRPATADDRYTRQRAKNRRPYSAMAA